jgi:hypothetical protein
MMWYKFPMPNNERSKRTYSKPEVRSLGTISSVTKTMMMGSFADMTARMMGM